MHSIRKRFLLRPLGLALMAVVSLPALAQDKSVHIDKDARKSLSLTIYNNDLAMVRDTRSVTLPKGDIRLEFADVSAQIKPETSIMNAPGLSVLEQNFDFDLLTPVKMLEKAVGSTVTIIRLNPATGAQVREKADVLSANGGAILKIDDRIEVLREDGLPTRVIFDGVPQNLRAKPTLSMLVAARDGGERTVDLTYLTNGLRWAADYVGTFDEDAGTLKIKGWITLMNNSGVSFENALTQVVAGDVKTVQDAKRYQRQRLQAAETVAVTGERVAQEETLFDYHLYTLPQPTTVANNQTKQVAFLEAGAVKAAKAYRFESWGFNTRERPENADVHIQFENKENTGLGKPLPKGVFRVYGQDEAGRPQFLGEDRIEHSAENAEVDLAIGEAFDVTVKSTRVDYDLISRSEREQTYEIEQEYLIANARDDGVVVALSQNGLNGNWQILEESHSHKKRSATKALWQVNAPAKSEVALRFKVRVTR